MVTAAVRSNIDTKANCRVHKQANQPLYGLAFQKDTRQVFSGRVNGGAACRSGFHPL